jgi:hypothetical protein
MHISYLAEALAKPDHAVLNPRLYLGRRAVPGRNQAGKLAGIAQVSGLVPVQRVSPVDPVLQVKYGPG